jgi:GMP reductase
MKIINREYNYTDVSLVPNPCIVRSRSECDTSIIFGNKKFDVPIVAANMPAVVNQNTCKFFAENNWFYIMHRFNIDQVSFIDFMKKNNHFTSISIGVNNDTYTQLKNIKAAKLDNEIDYATLDIAFCHSPKAEDMIKYFKDNFSNTFLIAGNYNTPESVYFLENLGVDATKCGIGGGKSCITRYKTGVYRPMVSCLLDCCSVAKKPIIADGGIEHHGHYAIAISCGATLVMSGSNFSCYLQSASSKIEVEGITKCLYYGNASEYNKASYTRVEGKKILMDYKGDMSNLLKEIKEDLQSSISYAGGKTLSSLLSCKLVAIN